MSVTAGTITGPYHKRNETENQDSFWFLEEGDFIVIAVADGAGSLLKSEIGAQLAASTAVNETMDALQVGRSFEEAVKIGVKEAREVLLTRDDVKEIGCTLAVGAMSLKGGWGAGVVGDAFVVVSLKTDDHKLVQPTSSAEFANVTKLLTSNDHDPLVVSGEELVEAISASSDGLLGSSTVGGEASPKFWNPLISRALDNNMDIQSFLYFMEEQERIDDDTTLVIATK